MLTINKIDFTKLMPFDGKATKCFEQLCYQIAREEYEHLGKFTSINGVGGDGGVEFYLTLKNGDEWGWQTKFFSDTGRLNVGGRKEQIKKSLKTSCKTHPKLKKWILCLKTDFTIDERKWFENKLPEVIPSNIKITLENWGETNFITFLKSTKHVGIRNFFFGELELDISWFKQKFLENFEYVKNKYDPDLHTPDKYLQSILDFNLRNKRYLSLIEDLENELKVKNKELDKLIENYLDKTLLSTDRRAKRKEFADSLKGFYDHRENIKLQLEEFKKVFSTTAFQSSIFDHQKFNSDFFNVYDQIKIDLWKDEDYEYREASEITYLISDYGEICNRFFESYFHSETKVIHILGEAAKGKTHLACDTCYVKINCDEPSIFIPAKRFSEFPSIEEGIRSVLSIPPNYSIDDFISALDICGEVCNIRIPIVIDALNETTMGRDFSGIWKNHLNSFESKISSYNNLVLITTCRTTYAKRIWDDLNSTEFWKVRGFDQESVILAVEKYFTKYKLKADLFFTSLDRFRDPIFLKLFCEVKNPGFRNKFETEVRIEDETIFDVFEEYMNILNQKVTKEKSFLRNGENFVKSNLSKVAKNFWDENARELELNDFYDMIDGKDSYEKERSKTDILIDEGLIISRDNYDDMEFLSFTYDLMGGYLIAKLIIEENNNFAELLTKPEFYNKIRFNNSNKLLHPLFEDILYTLCMLLPQMKGTHLYTLIKEVKADKELAEFNRQAFSQSVNALFDLNKVHVGIEQQELISNLFRKNDYNKNAFFNINYKTISVIDHPLNALFFSSELKNLALVNRDKTWTEYVRKNYNDFLKIIDSFEKVCNSEKTSSNIVIQKIHLMANYLQWVLTSTNRNLRDINTKALFCYGLHFPCEFSELVYKSLSFNDPYVWERMLSSLYGVCLSIFFDFERKEYRTKIITKISRQTFELYFNKNAKYYSTHILARDYARRIVKLGLKLDHSLLNEREIFLLYHPPKENEKIKWRVAEDAFFAHMSSDPIRMDFGNYTIGGLVQKGNAYNNPAEKRLVRGKIYWRIADLGYKEQDFKQIDIDASRDLYSGRNRPRIERYGKKYSWIAYYEIAGIRDDQNLLDYYDSSQTRISEIDIDPTFPEKREKINISTINFISPKTAKLVDWLKTGSVPDIKSYLRISNLNRLKGEWVCLDGYITQTDKDLNRNIFMFIKGLLVPNRLYTPFLSAFKNYKVNDGFYPSVSENYYSFLGEMVYLNDDLGSNWRRFNFVKEVRKRIIKIGEKGFSPILIFKNINDNEELLENYPQEIETEDKVYEKFNILQTVMGYNWESYHSHLNSISNINVPSKEIVNHLNLVFRPQSFNLYTINSEIASVSSEFGDYYNNGEYFTFIRRDLIEKFCIEKNMKLLWYVWGERQIEDHENCDYDNFIKQHKIEPRIQFQSIFNDI